MTLNIVSLIPRAQSLKNGSTYPALPYVKIKPSAEEMSRRSFRSACKNWHVIYMHYL